MEERREKFIRDDLLENIDKITKFLFKLRFNLEVTCQREQIQTPVILRHYVHVKEEITSKEFTTTRCEILMECLSDELESTHHSMDLEETTSGLSIKPKQLDFVCTEMPSGMKVEKVII